MQLITKIILLFIIFYYQTELFSEEHIYFIKQNSSNSYCKFNVINKDIINSKFGKLIYKLANSYYKITKKDIFIKISSNEDNSLLFIYNDKIFYKKADIILKKEISLFKEIDIYYFYRKISKVILFKLNRFKISKYNRVHTIFSITDYNSAFYDGFSYFIVKLAFEQKNIKELYLNRRRPKYIFQNQWYVYKEIDSLIDKIENNEFIYQKYIPNFLVSNNKKDNILKESYSDCYNLYDLKNSQQLLSSAGVVATLFYRFYKIDNNFENMFLSINRISLEDKEPIIIRFIKSYKSIDYQFYYEIKRIFLLTTYFSTIDKLSSIEFRNLKVFGILRNSKQFSTYIVRLITKAMRAFEEDNIFVSLDKEIWLENREVKINGKFIHINLNSASFYELLSFDGINKEIAKKLINYRKKKYFDSIEEAVKVGFKAKNYIILK